MAWCYEHDCPDSVCERQHERLSTSALAELIVDALVDGGTVKEEDFDKAVEITVEEINARKAMGDY